MATFVKAQAASVTATLVDFAITILLVECMKVWPVTATAIGNICGGITNFLMGRRWVFKSTHQKIPLQAVKYGLVWGGNLLLNTWGVYVVTHFTQIPYLIAKIVVSLIVGFTYNYFLQKRFVFK